MRKYIDYIDDWQDLYQKCVAENNKNGRECQEAADYSNSVMADFCEDLILQAKKAYYDTGEPIMDDLTFDNFENRLKLLRPNSKILEKVGS